MSLCDKDETINIDNKNENEDKSKLNKDSQNVEEIIKKWLYLQKTIKEEITLEDVIINQQKADSSKIKDLYKKLYDQKVQFRQSIEDINKLEQGNLKDIKQFCLIEKQKDITNYLFDATDPIRKLFIFLRKNFDYISRIVSLIDESDEMEKVESLCELFCNQFYDNILIPNPEQEELLILIYKLIEQEITPMISASLDEFLSEGSFLGKFMSIFTRKHEIKVYLMLLINPIIKEIENEGKDCMDVSLTNILQDIKYSERNKDSNAEKRIDNSNSIEGNNNGLDSNYDILKYLCGDIKHSSIKFKKIAELEAEQENEEEGEQGILIENVEKKKFIEEYPVNKLDENLNINESEENILANQKSMKEDLNKDKKTDLSSSAKNDKNSNNKNNDQIRNDDSNSKKELLKYNASKRRLSNSILGESDKSLEDVKTNDDYSKELNQDKLNEILQKEKDKDIQDFYLHQLEQINSDTEIFSNKGLKQILLEESIFSQYQTQILKKYKENFVFIKNKIDKLLQSMIDKISSIPYTVRCICKIISLLMSKKFPLLGKFLRNSFIGKFIFDKCIFPVLSLESKNVIPTTIFSIGTRKCLNVIVSVLSNANKCSLFTTNTDTEKTIFNYYLLEIIPIINKFYDMLVDVQLPKVLDELVSQAKSKIQENGESQIFNFRHRNEKKKLQDIQKPKTVVNKNKVLYDFFKENNEEIMHIQSVCFTAQDILFIINLLYRDKNYMTNFSDLPDYTFFQKTIERIKGEDYKIDEVISKEPNKRIFFILDEEIKNKELDSSLNKAKNFTKSFKNENDEVNLVCRRIKSCIKYILKGLNLLNCKDYPYLNRAKTNEKFLNALKLTSDDLGEISEDLNVIPLSWYADYIKNNRTMLGSEYIENDYNKLYDEILSEEIGILNELKQFSSIVIARNGMNVRCAEKMVERSKRSLEHIKIANRFLKIEKFIQNVKVEVCIQTKEKDKIDNKNNSNTKEKEANKKKDGKEEKPLEITISEPSECVHSVLKYLNQVGSGQGSQKNETHALYVRDFISKFSEKPWKDTIKNVRPIEIIKKEIQKGSRDGQIYKSIDKYMEIIKNKIKESRNDDLFKNVKDDELAKILFQIKDHIIRNIYKYVYPNKPLQKDKEFYDKTKSLEWVKPEMLAIKKVYINQLKNAILSIKKMDKAKSINEKIECIFSAHNTLNNTIKFSTGKDAGQDEITPIFQYVIIKAQPKRIYSDINYIECFFSDTENKSQSGFMLAQLKSATMYIEQLTPEMLKH